MRPSVKAARQTRVTVLLSIALVLGAVIIAFLSRDHDLRAKVVERVHAARVRAANWLAPSDLTRPATALAGTCAPAAPVSSEPPQPSIVSQTEATPVPSVAETLMKPAKSAKKRTPKQRAALTEPPMETDTVIDPGALLDRGLEP